jgi:DNA-directed RNA polymerase subunit RPC12/RpoP
MGIEIVGENEEAKRKASCRKCGAVLLYLPIDVQQKDYRDYSGVSDTSYWIDCPRCRNKIVVKPC